MSKRVIILTVGRPAAPTTPAFEAFCTTKDVGKGAGLGLDTARRIVEEDQGGTITIKSQPGDTVVRVRIPVRPTTASGSTATAEAS